MVQETEIAPLVRRAGGVNPSDGSHEISGVATIFRVLARALNAQFLHPRLKRRGLQPKNLCSSAVSANASAG